MRASPRRSDKWWEARYAKSQALIEQGQREASTEIPIPYVPALSTLTAPDGSQFMLRLIPPGEPLDHVGRFVATAMLLALLSRGTVSYTAENQFFIAVVERQRGPWRGFDKVAVRYFHHYADAAQFLQIARQNLEHGRPVQ